MKVIVKKMEEPKIVQRVEIGSDKQESIIKLKKQLNKKEKDARQAERERLTAKEEEKKKKNEVIRERYRYDGGLVSPPHPGDLYFHPEADTFSWKTSAASQTTTKIGERGRGYDDRDRDRERYRERDDISRRDDRRRDYDNRRRDFDRTKRTLDSYDRNEESNRRRRYENDDYHHRDRYRDIERRSDHRSTRDRYYENEESRNRRRSAERGKDLKNRQPAKFDRYKGRDSDSDDIIEADIDLDEDDKEEKEIERRRKQRQELLKKLGATSTTNSIATDAETSNDVSMANHNQNEEDSMSVPGKSSESLGPTTFSSILKTVKEEKVKEVSKDRKQFDMFSDEKEDVLVVNKEEKNNGHRNHENPALLDNWDDSEGYYRKLFFFNGF